MNDLDRRILRMESRRYYHPGAKDAAIRSELDLNPTRYYQRVNQLLDEPAAVVEFPMLTARLRRLRDEQRKLRGPRVSADAARILNR